MDRLLSLEKEDRDRYWREFIFNIQEMYELLAQGVNGDIRSENSEPDVEFTPTLQGTMTSGTFSYDHRVGWLYRRNLFTEIWFDVKWNGSGSAAGHLYLELPYKVAVSNQKPFVGVVQSSGITYTGGTGIVINGIQDTFRGEFWNVGSGFPTANQDVVASGQLIGYLRYLGQEDE